MNPINESLCGLGGVSSGDSPYGERPGGRDPVPAARSRLIFTACEANELSAQNAKLDGGHGVFTYHLLEGLKGEADGFAGNRDGLVSLGELIDYTTDAVKRVTRRQQRPDTAGSFDRSLVMGKAN